MVNYKKIIFVSLIITILIFIAGVLLGLSLGDVRVSDLINIINQNELNTESYLIEQDFIKNLGGNLCDVSGPRISVLSSELARLGQLLTRYDSTGTSILNANGYDYIKRKYFLLEIKTYILFTNLKKDCGYKFDIILYFYDRDHQESLNQGYILDSLVASRNNLHVFSFDRNFEEPTLETVKLHYNITKSPTLVINNEIKKEGLTTLEELKEMLK